MSSQRYVPAIDGLRAAAVLAVLGFHAATGPLSGAFLGVDVFFVISGYVITTSLLADRTGRGRGSLRAFYRRRFWRLAPALVAMLAVAGLLDLIFGITSASTFFSEAAYTLTGTYNLWEGFGGGGLYLTHAWSLGVEEQFYLLWAPLFLLVLVARSWKTQLCTAVALLLLSALSRLLTTELAGTRQAFFLPWNRLDELLTGVVLALLISRHRAQVARYSGPVAAWASAAVLTVLCVAIPTLFDPRLGRGGFLGIALLSAVLVAHAETGTSTLNNLLSHPVSVWLGQRSYGFYLFHFPLVVLIRDHYGQRPLTVLLVVLPTTIVLSDLSFRFWEVPLRRRGRSPMTEAAR